MSKKRAGRSALFLSVSFFSGVALLMALQNAADGFLAHPRFMVSEIEVKWQGAADAAEPGQFRLNPPVSIFQLDLEALSRAFRQRYPMADVERMDRVLPNRLIATLRARHVVAQLQAGGLYAPVSDDGRIVGAATRAPQAGLPVLILEGVRGPLSAGRSVEANGFWKVSELLSTVYRDKGIAGRRVSQLQVNGTDVSVRLEKGPEIRFSTDRLGDGWQDLWGLLSRKQTALDEARYIDLRFQDPVIAPLKAPLKSRTH